MVQLECNEEEGDQEEVRAESYGVDYIMQGFVGSYKDFGFTQNEKESH